MANHLGAVALLQHLRISDVIVVEVRDDDGLERVLLLVEQADQKLAHAVAMFGQRPVAAVDQQILTTAADQINAALHISVEFVGRERPVDAGNAPAVRRFGPEEQHQGPSNTGRRPSAGRNR